MLLNDDQRGKFVTKLNELYCELLILFTHNMNLKDLAFQYEDYDFISQYKHSRHDEAEHLEGYSPRDLEP